MIGGLQHNQIGRLTHQPVAARLGHTSNSRMNGSQGAPSPFTSFAGAAPAGEQSGGARLPLQAPPLAQHQIRDGVSERQGGLTAGAIGDLVQARKPAVLARLLAVSARDNAKRDRDGPGVRPVHFQRPHAPRPAAVMRGNLHPSVERVTENPNRGFSS